MNIKGRQKTPLSILSILLNVSTSCSKTVEYKTYCIVLRYSETPSSFIAHLPLRDNTKEIKGRESDFWNSKTEPSIKHLKGQFPESYNDFLWESHVMKSNFLKRESSPSIPRLRDRCLIAGGWAWRHWLLCTLSVSLLFNHSTCTAAPQSCSLPQLAPEFLIRFQAMVVLLNVLLNSIGCLWSVFHVLRDSVCSSRKGNGCVSSVAVKLCTRSNLWSLSTYSLSDWLQGRSVFAE